MKVDDILKLLTLMDERLALDSLPIYVAENVDCLPSMKWADGDFQMIMTKLAKMEKECDGIRLLISGLAENQSLLSYEVMSSTAENKSMITSVESKVGECFGNVVDLIVEYKVSIDKLNANKSQNVGVVNDGAPVMSMDIIDRSLRQR